MAYGNKAEYIDVKSDASNMEKMLRYSEGERQVPVIVQNKKVTIGYGGT